MEIAFLLYDSRSGSTFLSSLLNQYDGIKVSKETAYFSRVLAYPDEIVDETSKNRFIDYLFEEIHFLEAGFERKMVEKGLNYPMSKFEIIQTLMNIQFSNITKGDWSILKHTPSLYLETAIDEFPESKFIAIVRDGRDVFLSKKNTNSTKGRSMSRGLIHSAIKWRKHLMLLDQIPKSRALVIRYEDLIYDPNVQIDRILKFLGKEGSPIVRSSEAYSENIGRIQLGLHKNVGNEIMRENHSKWKREMSQGELYLYYAIAGHQLVGLGYPRYLDGLDPRFKFYFSFDILKHVFLFIFNGFDILKAKTDQWFSSKITRLIK